MLSNLAHFKTIELRSVSTEDINYNYVLYALSKHAIVIGVIFKIWRKFWCKIGKFYVSRFCFSLVFYNSDNLGAPTNITENRVSWRSALLNLDNATKKSIFWQTQIYWITTYFTSTLFPSEEGVMGFYAGIFPHLLGEVCSKAVEVLIQVPSYWTIKHLFRISIHILHTTCNQTTVL